MSVDVKHRCDGHTNPTARRVEQAFSLPPSHDQREHGTLPGSRLAAQPIEMEQRYRRDRLMREGQSPDRVNGRAANKLDASRAALASC
jgi:hypothetical protein